MRWTVDALERAARKDDAPASDCINDAFRSTASFGVTDR
jgi:hypothetical protein